MQPILALGTMSGTSLDGVDAAEVLTDGEAIHGFGRSIFRAYTDAERDILHAALGKWPRASGVAEAARIVEDRHAATVSELPDAGVIGFHGQTLAHDPEARRTHQAGDGAALAERLGRTVVWDFRSTDVALGGEGAPLAPIFHHACARHIGADAPLAFLNLGGVGNLTWVDPARDAPEGLLAFDTGPANAPIDDLCRARLGQGFDRDGALGSVGTARPDLVAGLLRVPFFNRPPPKSLDRDAFRAAGAAIDALDTADAVATWVAVVAATVAGGLRQCPTPPVRVLVTGGGRRNSAIMSALSATLPCPVEPVEVCHLDGDMLEAQAFAYLAVRVMRGLPTSFPMTTGVPASTTGGIVTDPARGTLDAGHQARVG